MRIFFRTDASLQIGTGHVMRTLTLADALRERGAKCTFICRPLSGHLIGLIAHRGYPAVRLPVLSVEHRRASAGPSHAGWLGTDWQTDAQQTQQALNNEAVDWLVVDHYALDRSWEQVLRPYCKRLMVIDDLADRPHDCDLLLDQNLGRTKTDYSGLLCPNTTTLIGPQYALLRPAFAQLRSYSLARRTEPRLQQLLITMGGVDKDNATAQVLDTLKGSKLPADLQITVVMGPDAPWLQQVQTQAMQMQRPTRVLVGVSNMAQIMADSDFAIGAAGSTSWERCCLGVPSVLLVLAKNQQAGAVALQRAGAVVLLKSTKDIPQLMEQVALLVGDSSSVHALSMAAATVTDGNGVARTIEKFMGLYV